MICGTGIFPVPFFFGKSMIEVLKVGYPSIAAMRNERLNMLPAFQDVYLELMIPSSDYFLITSNESEAGYAIRSANGILIEFYLKEEYIVDCPVYFDLIIYTLNVKRIYCQSFDALLLNCCVLKNHPYRIEGWLFRDFLHTENFFKGDMALRFAGKTDYPLLYEQPDGLYESPEELEMLINGQNILMFYLGSSLVGCGFLIQVHPDFSFYDIGMWVHPDFRRKSFATQIISYLKHLCLENNWTPICGCAADNEASQKTLAKNGFFSKYKLIEFCVQTK